MLAIPPAVDTKDLVAQRIAGDRGARERGAVEGHRAGAGEAGHKAIGAPRHRVLLGDDDRDSPEDRGQAARHAGVPTEGHDDRRTAPADHRHRPHEGHDESGDGADVLEGELALQTSARKHREPEAGFGNESRLDAAVATDEVDGLRRVSPGNQRLADGDPGEDVTGGPPAGNHRPSAVA